MGDETTGAPVSREAWIAFAMHYGPRCRDCADEDGICPATGMPCGASRKPTEHVIDALIYGLKHGFIHTTKCSGMSAPTDRVIQATIRVPVRWHPYSPKSQEVKRGKMGRWQSMNEFGGWTNLYPNKPPETWEEVDGRHLEGGNLTP